MDPTFLQAKWKLSCTAGLVLLFLTVEVGGGIRSGSLAILTDAAHLLTDAIGIFISLTALILAAKKPTQRMSYGYHRLEILGALISLLLIWAVTIVLVVEATMRIIQPVEVDGKLMLAVASFGIFMNIIMVCILHGTEMAASTHSCCHAHDHGSMEPAEYMLVQHAISEKNPLITNSHVCCHHRHHHSHDEDAPDMDTDNTEALVAPCDTSLHDSNRSERRAGRDAGGADNLTHCSNGNEANGTSLGYKVLDIDAERTARPKNYTNVNVRSAYLHVLGDLIQSAGVAVAGLVIYFHPSWKILDPICTYVFSTMVLLTTRKLFYDVTGVLLERTPDSVDPALIRRCIAMEAGVQEVVDLHIWSITFDQVALTARLVVKDNTNRQALLDQVKQQCQSLGVQHATLEMVEKF